MSVTTREQTEIYRLYASLRSSAGAGVLATIVATSGSTYRKPGARMLVTDDGRSAGLISGGCLENDLHERSAVVSASGKPLLVTYDSTSGDDILWGLGLGCTGIAHVLLERISGTERCAALEFIEECRRRRCAGAIATPYAGDAIPELSGDGRVFAREGETGNRETTGDPAALLHRACADALAAGDSSHVTLALPGGTTEAFIEYIAPPVPLFVFGAGPDAAPLVQIASGLGWHVTVVDRRPAYLTQSSFPSADALILAHPGETRDAVLVPPGAAAVIMTHNFPGDVEIARALLPSPAVYVGLLGPRAKANLLLDNLAGEGVLPTEEELAKFHSPAGLDIGGDTPEEIALSIIAEIQSVLHNRPGTPLRLREGPIHR